MVPQRHRISYYTVVTGLFVALASTFMACGFNSPSPTPPLSLDIS